MARPVRVGDVHGRPRFNAYGAELSTAEPVPTAPTRTERIVEMVIVSVTTAIVADYVLRYLGRR